MEENDLNPLASRARRARLRVKSLGDAFIKLAATFWARMILMVIFLAALAVLMWLMVWKPLMAPVRLPAGVLLDPPAVASDLLKTVNDQRSRRTQAGSVRFDLTSLFGVK